MKQNNILITEASADYELLDSGEGEKLERFGQIILSRPDPQALWSKRLDSSEWKKAHGKFGKEGGNDNSGWVIKKEMPKSWTVELEGLKFETKPTTFKHVGIFPEQALNWRKIEENVKAPAYAKASAGKQNTNDKSKMNNEVEVLNLFGYTGGASLASAKAGAKVVHVDGSKVAVNWAKENAKLSGLEDKPIRWILDDARTFVGREIKRERKYDGIIMDPPAFGHGPEGELWKIEEHFLSLVKDCFKILKDKPLFFLINGYSAGYSSLAYGNILLELVAKYGGQLETGELAILESKRANLPQRLLPCGIYARWTKA